VTLAPSSHPRDFLCQRPVDADPTATRARLFGALCCQPLWRSAAMPEVRPHEWRTSLRVLFLFDHGAMPVSVRLSSVVCYPCAKPLPQELVDGPVVRVIPNSPDAHCAVCRRAVVRPGPRCVRADSPVLGRRSSAQLRTACAVRTSPSAPHRAASRIATDTSCEILATVRSPGPVSPSLLPLLSLRSRREHRPLTNEEPIGRCCHLAYIRPELHT